MQRADTCNVTSFAQHRAQYVPGEACPVLVPGNIIVPSPCVKLAMPSSNSTWLRMAARCEIASIALVLFSTTNLRRLPASFAHPPQREHSLGHFPFRPK